MNRIILFFFAISTPFCKAAMMKSIFKDPIVETNSSIMAFQTKNGFSTGNSLILKGDTNSAEVKLMTCLTDGYYVFDSNGNHLCYKGMATCQGTQFRELIEGKDDNFSICKTDTLSIVEVLNSAYDFDDKQQSISNYPKTDYYVIVYWAKFFGGKRGYKENVKWMEDEVLKANAVKTKVTFIKINTDLQESWGLIAGEKVDLKFRMNEKKATIELGQLPIKK